MGIIITLDSSKEWDNTSSSDCIEIFKEKPVRLFGFEINPSGAACEYNMSNSRGSSGRDESPNTSRDTVSSKRVKVGNKSSKKFKCQSCFKAFGSSQALGGHQNAHKKQKTMKSNNKKIQGKAQHGGGSNTSSWCFDQCSKSQINFSSSDPISCALAKAETRPDSKTSVFTLTTSDHNNDLNLVGSTKSFNKFLDLQLGLSLQPNLIYS